MDIPVNSRTAIIFDLDDTLYNELDYLRSAYRHIAKTLDPLHWKLLYGNMFSLYRNQENVFNYLEERYNVSKTDLLSTYRTHLPEIAPFTGVIELLQKIKARDGYTGLLTDGRSTTQRNKIKALEIESYLDLIVISEELGSEKPDEQNYRIFQDTLNADTFYYIGDNPKKDFITANRLGWKTVGLIDNGKNVHTHMQKYSEQEAYAPDNYLLDLREIKLV